MDLFQIRQSKVRQFLFIDQKMVEIFLFCSIIKDYHVIVQPGFIINQQYQTTLGMKTTSCRYIIPLFLFIQCGLSYSIVLLYQSSQVSVGYDSQINSEFMSQKLDLCCTMPQLYIYNDTHQNYSIKAKGVKITNVKGKYLPIQSNIQCQEGQILRCDVIVNNGCPYQSNNQMNWIVVNTENNEANFQYLVNCNPSKFYKPFEWGLFILIFFCTITITISSVYSRAFSYQGFGVNVPKISIIIFSIVIIHMSILAYYYPIITSIGLKVIGSAIGVIGVMVCTAEALWLLKNRTLNAPALGKLRLIDLIGFGLGSLLIIFYWISDGMWLVNDLLAVCTIVTGIKILKIRSLKNGVFMLFVLLTIQIIGGLVVHYFLKRSYNNLVIQMFESPLVIVFPSITPELYRRCAWIPLTNILFPGLFISYLRRFDKSRGTFLYLFIGYGSFYFGSILWMIIDMNITHSLPMAIISDPIMTVIICFFAMRRNQLKTIWHGRFYDAELPDVAQNILPDKQNYYIPFTDITQSLKIDKNRESNIES